MVAHVILNEPLNNSAPEGMLDYDKNCVSLAMGRVLGIGVHAAINLCIAKGWASKAVSMQYDETILAIMAGLSLSNRTMDKEWFNVKPLISTWPDGRYFACNSKADKMGGKGTGHAFAILKRGGWGTDANNSEDTKSTVPDPLKRRTYASKIIADHHVSVWGPA